MSQKNVRVRFAPSPTGPLHMGGIRTALYNYLFAKKNKGDFILRIEDTDQGRYVPGAEKYIIDALNWCGLVPDESPVSPGDFGPYRQSERKQMYRQYADMLIEKGFAYYAFDTPEDLENMRDLAKKAKMPNWQYNVISRTSMKNSLTLSADETEKILANGDPFTIRIKMPRNEDVRFYDEIRGWVIVNTNNMDDKVIFKGDGMPTYHLANVVDDYSMKISHVIRGEEWLPSAPLHVLLYKYLGWEEVMPKFAHLPLILKPDGNGKLSKRDGDRLGFPVFPLEWTDPETKEVSSGYKEKGYFKDAFINMLAFLGWNPGDSREIFSLPELIAAFSLERVGKSGAKFDPDKTKWFNQQYLRSKSNNELAELLQPKTSHDVSLEYLEGVAGLMKERASFVEELLLDDYFFTAPKEYDAKTLRKKWKPATATNMELLKTALMTISDFKAEKIESVFKDFLLKNELGMGAALPNFRLLVTGKGMGPSMFETAALLGKDEVLKRFENGIQSIENIKAKLAT
ncbi:MAG: glutamate--tRNA ligase [Flavobacteriales bacterium]|nr:glutamate--tRNA ligase [Flavobacteriales bacterium]